MSSQPGAKRKIRILVAKPGLDGHDVGAKLVVRALTDAGMEAIYSGLKRSPAEIAERAKAENVDAVGLSIMSGAHLVLCRKIKEELVAQGLGDTMVVAGGVIPVEDHQKLEAMGIARVFPVGTPFEQIVEFLREKVVL